MIGGYTKLKMASYQFGQNDKWNLKIINKSKRKDHSANSNSIITKSNLTDTPQGVLKDLV